MDSIVCLSVNDPFVMKAWCDANKAGNDIIFLADGNAALSSAIGLTFDGSLYSLGNKIAKICYDTYWIKSRKNFYRKTRSL